MQQTYQTLQVQVGQVAEITLTRPEALNALNTTMLNELSAALQALQDSADLRCLILCGAGERAFVAGADIALMSQMESKAALAFATLGQGVCNAVEHFPVPVLAAVQGFALGGGCELALACDVVYAADTAKFGQPEVKLGLLPGFGGTSRLPAKLGPAAAAEWMYTGAMYKAQRAFELGWVQAVLPAAQLLTHVRQVGATIAQQSPLAIRCVKQLLVQQANTQQGMAFERSSFARLFASGETHEGTQAFVQKRPPQFQAP